MPDRNLWDEWVERYDLFVSYARTDNEPPHEMVSAVVEGIEADFARFSPTVPLKVFFDKHAIVDMERWQDKLKKGLRQSKVMLAFLSEAYFASEWCRREWEEYVLVEQSRTYPGEALSPIFVVAPPELAKRIPPAARDWWADVTRRNAVVEIHPYWPRGRAALQEVVVANRLGRLTENIVARVEHGRALAGVPRKVGGRNPNFVGRRADLARVRDALARYELSVVCAVNGVGGIGKSALAREYAYLFRREYLGGQFEIDLSTVDGPTGMKAALVDLARGYLKAVIPVTLSEDAQHAAALAAFNTLPAGQTVLLILDNLNETAAHLIGADLRDTLYPSQEKVHLLVTTRADPADLGEVNPVTLDVLDAADALDVLFRYRQYARRADDPEYLAARDGTFALTAEGGWPDEQEWKAALAIVNRLGRHTLAVTLVGAFLRVNPSLSYGEFHRQLAAAGIGLTLDTVGSKAKVAALIAHPTKLIGPLFEKSLVLLDPLALRVLEYAAFLPPDKVPVAWLTALVGADPELADAQTAVVGTSPLNEALERLNGLQYLIGGPYARMHRVVQEVVRRRMSDAERERRQRTVLGMVESRCVDIHNSGIRFADLDELSAAEQLARAWSGLPDQYIGHVAMALVPSYQVIGRLGTASDLASTAERQLRGVVRTTPDNTQVWNSLSIALNKVGDVRAARGDLGAALAAYDEGLGVARRRAAADPDNAGWQRDLSVSLDKVGDVRAARGDLGAALAAYDEGLGVARRLAAADPDNAGWQRDLSVSLNKVGDVRAARGDLGAALAAYDEGLGVARRLATADPDNAGWQRDLSVSLIKVGDVRAARGDLGAALAAYDEGLGVARRRAAADPDNAGWQRDLSVSLIKVGDVRAARGDLGAALAAYDEGLGVARRLAAADPDNAGWQRDLSVSLNKVGDVRAARGDLGAALAAYDEGLGVARRLATADPDNAGWQRDLSVSLIKVGDVRAARGDLGAALAAYDEGLGVARRRAAADPDNAGWQRDLSVSLNKVGDVRAARGDLGAALAAYDEGLGVARRLATADPDNAGWQRDLSVSLIKVGDVRAARGDLGAALAAYDEGLGIRRRLATADPDNVEWQRDLSVSFDRIGEVRRIRGDLDGALEAFQNALAIDERLAAADPTDARGRQFLVGSYHRLAGLYHQLGRADESVASLLSCYKTLDAMRAAGMHLVPHLADLHAHLSALFNPPAAAPSDAPP